MPEIGYYVLDDDGQTRQVSLDEWARSSDPDARRLALTDVGEACVSTVFLGIDHQFGDGPPLLFETMIFRGEHDQHCERWATRDQAVTGHQRIVAALRDGRAPETATAADDDCPDPWHESRTEPTEPCPACGGQAGPTTPAAVADTTGEAGYGGPAVQKRLVDLFNEAYPVGTPVRYWTGVREGDGRTSTTRTPAQMFGGHTAVVWVEGEASCIALSHVAVAR